MIKTIVAFEVKYSLRNWAIYFICLLLFSGVMFAVLSDHFSFGGSIEGLQRNSPFAIALWSITIAQFSPFFLSGLINQTALRDFQSQYHEFIFTKPISKAQYLLGRLASTWLLGMLFVLMVPLAVVLGSHLFYDNQEQVNSFSFAPYTEAFFYFSLPNVLIFNTILFSVAIASRKIAVLLGAAVVLFVIMFAVIGISLADPESVLISFFEPSGFVLHKHITRLWSFQEKNHSMFGWHWWLVIHRICWLTVAACLFLWAFRKFKFQLENGQSATRADVKNIGNTRFDGVALPYTLPENSAWSRWTQAFVASRTEIAYLFKSKVFLILVALCILQSISSITTLSSWNPEGTINYPTTGIVLENFSSSIMIVIYAIVVIYGGLLVHHDRDSKMHPILDSYNMPSWAFYFSKLFALSMGLLAIISGCMASGIIAQAAMGYYRLQLDLYLLQLVVVTFAGTLLPIMVLSFLVHSLVANRYVAFMIVGFILILVHMVLPEVEFNDHLLLYSSLPSFTYSDFNGLGPYRETLLFHVAYGVAVSAVLIVITILFWRRGEDQLFRYRWSTAKETYRKSMRMPLIAALLFWMVIGGYIFYNTHILNSPSNENALLQRAAYEKQYSHYEDLDQPRITSVNYSVNIFPGDRKMTSTTQFWIRNKTSHPIDTLFFTLNVERGLTQKVMVEKASELRIDQKLGVAMYKLNNPLQVGDSLSAIAKASYTIEGFENEVSSPLINENGTFINSSMVLPIIGYARVQELTKKEDRERYGLPPQGAQPRPDDLVARRNQYFICDADWISMQTTVSTSEDQIAIAPGKLLRQWKDAGRNYYRYALDKPVLHFATFTSAKYQVHREKWNEVDIEIYYDDDHSYNIERMAKAMRTSLDYCSSQFGPYPHKVARIIEFPRYEIFAQSFATTMPYSEGIGFIENVTDENSLGLMQHTVAHEIAHQWWAHQVVPGYAAGASFVTETLAQYSASCILEKLEGEKKNLAFVLHDRSSYMTNRGRLSEPENALVFVEDQPNVYYNKGTQVMHALKKLIGEDSLNHAIKRFFADNAYQPAPYTTGKELLGYLRVVAPDSLRYFITDQFELITFHDNAVKGAQIKLSRGMFEVSIDLQCRKYRVDGKGFENEIPINDYVEVTAFYEGDKSVTKTVKATSESMKVSFLVPGKPTRVVVDPNNLMMDRFQANNVFNIP